MTYARGLIVNYGAINTYPNPNNGQFTLSLPTINKQAQVQIYNVIGEEIYKATINSNDTEINLAEQPIGIYLYRVLTEDGNIVGCGKVIIEH
jgi:hypothetical protein